MSIKKTSSGRRSFLLGLGSLGGLGIGTLLHKLNSESVFAQQDSKYLNSKSNKANDIESLRQIAASKGILYGGFHQRSPSDFAQDLKFQRTFLEDYGLIVGGFFGVTVGPFGADNYNFNEIDPFFNFAQQNNLAFRGHPMIWNQFNSPWLVEKFKSANTTNAEIEQIFATHISTLGKKYAGRVNSWDVVNEVINVEDGRPDGLRDTMVSGFNGDKYPTWLKFLGPGYIQRAFVLAHEADPGAKLILNETALEYSNALGNSYWEKRRSALLALLTKLKANGTPIHALGLQSHLLARLNKDFDGNKFRKFLSDVASLGLKIIITELDVSDIELPQNIEVRDRIVAESYYEYLSVVLDEPAVTTVVNWGLTDRYTWLSDFAPRKDGAPVRPLLRDRQYNQKPAWKAVARALNEAPTR
ncbi:MAG: endo-1,4-beta-xylanase [Pleurocapsa minor HA4230-MV1]|jgi:endo-1,4-beta-xylanase|nr:endo-1,4-beta-xylanase [Pleurocapsa minor HA4230-MV1]